MGVGHRMWFWGVIGGRKIGAFLPQFSSPVILADKVLCREPTGHELTSMIIPPGACWLLHGSTIHRGGANSSNDTHRLLGASWTQGHMRQEENQYLATPKEEAMKLPEETQRLIGYKINAPMGWVLPLNPERFY